MLRKEKNSEKMGGMDINHLVSYPIFFLEEGAHESHTEALVMGALRGLCASLGLTVGMLAFNCLLQGSRLTVYRLAVGTG